MATVCFILLLLLLNVIFEHLDKDNNKLWHGDPVKLIFSKNIAFSSKFPYQLRQPSLRGNYRIIFLQSCLNTALCSMHVI